MLLPFVECLGRVSDTKYLDKIKHTHKLAVALLQNWLSHYYCYSKCEQRPTRISMHTNWLITLLRHGKKVWQICVVIACRGILKQRDRLVVADWFRYICIFRLLLSAACLITASSIVNFVIVKGYFAALIIYAAAEWSIECE